MYKEQRLADGLRPGAVNRELAVRSGRLPHRPHVALLDESDAVRELQRFGTKHSTPDP